jgi:hypothetical protein
LVVAALGLAARSRAGSSRGRPPPRQSRVAAPGPHASTLHGSPVIHYHRRCALCCVIRVGGNVTHHEFLPLLVEGFGELRPKRVCGGQTPHTGWR